MRIEWTEKGGIHYLHSPEWHNAGVAHGFLGASVDSRSDPQRCDECVRFLCNGLMGQVSRLRQTHSTLIERAPSRAGCEGDGWFVERCVTPGVFGIETADCAPVLIRDSVGRFVAALHCGWRGTCAGILMFALREFSQHGLRPEQLEILIGPAAGVCCYEVGPDLIEILKQSWGETGLVRREDKFYFNLAALLREQALSWGLRPEAIACAQVCTICDFRFFSFRRQKDLSGRQLSFISSV